MAALAAGPMWQRQVTARRRSAALSVAAAVGALSALCSRTSTFVAPPTASSLPTGSPSALSDTITAPAAQDAVTGSTQPSAALLVAVTALAAAGAQRSARRGGSRVQVAQSGSDTEVAVKEPEVAAADAEAPVVEVAGGAAVAKAPDSNWNMLGRRMWTQADALHIHAISGIAHTGIGLVYLIDIVVTDLARLFGTTYSGPHVPIEVVLASMVVGAINAVSGLQPALVPRPFKDFEQLLGFGEDGNLRAAGFVNTAMFYFILTYQSLRVVPDYPAALMPLDPLFAAVSLAALFHTIFIINSWVGRGQLSQGFAIAMSAPLLLNVPVSLHLLLEGQAWVEKLTAVYPGWPEVFFAANYALAWAGSLVTLVLSLYERKVCNITERLLMTVFIGLICFTVIPLHGYLYVPQWFNGEQMVMLTLIPP